MDFRERGKNPETQKEYKGNKEIDKKEKRKIVVFVV
jgi:hypothetical protein